MSVSAGGAGASISSLWNNPTLLGQLLPGVNVQGLQGVLQAEEALVAAPLTQYQQDQTTYSNQAQAYSAIQGALTTVASDAQTLSTSSGFAQTAAPVTSNNQVVTATGTGGPYGDYALVVGALATPGSVYSAPQASATTSLGWSGQLTVTVNVGIPPATVPIVVNVPVASGDSLNTIAANLQSAAASTLPSGTALSAAVLPSSSNGQSGDSLVVSVNGGLTPASITSSGSVPNLGWTQASTYQPSSYSIDGVQNQSSSNTIQNALPGVTLNLQGTGSATLSIASQPSATATQVNQLVTDVQNAITTIQKYTGQGQVLAGDPAMTTLPNQLESVLQSVVTGQPAGYQSLSDLGLQVSYSTQNGASITFDQAAFTNALTTNPQAAQNLFTTAGTGLASQMQSLLNQYTQPATGILASDLGSVQQNEQQLASQEGALQQMVTQQQTTLQNQFMANLQQISNNLSQSSFVQGYVAAITGQAGSSSSSSTGGAGG